MSTPEAIRAQILDLVRQYHTAKFAPKSFDPNKDLVHYSGRVFDAEEIVNLVDAGLDFYLTARDKLTGTYGHLFFLIDPITHLLNDSMTNFRYALYSQPFALSYKIEV